MRGRRIWWFTRTRRRRRKGKKPADKKIKEAFQFPTPSDLTAKDLAPNKPKAKKEEQEKERGEERDEACSTQAPGGHNAALLPSGSQQANRFRLDGHWRHIFFTYDGSGKASGVQDLCKWSTG